MTRRPIADILAELETRDLRHDFETIAKKHGVNLWDVFGRRRFDAFTAARHECMYLLLVGRGWSTTRVGELFCVDHTTVAAGCRSHERRMAKAFMREVRGNAA